MNLEQAVAALHKAGFDPEWIMNVVITLRRAGNHPKRAEVEAEFIALAKTYQAEQAALASMSRDRRNLN